MDSKLCCYYDQQKPNVRCKRVATVRLKDPAGGYVAQGAYCDEHGEGQVHQYNEKIGPGWWLEPIEERAP